MEPIYVKNFTIDDRSVDCFGALKASAILFLAQEMGGQHSALLQVDYDTLANRRMFWAVTRHRVQITRLPHSGEKLRMETWPLPATRVAYPRSVVAYDEAGNECFRAITLWVLMDMDTRGMILPEKSGISVVGTLRGDELPSPIGLFPKANGNVTSRPVRFCDLDGNGHMNNTRCMDWIDDLLPSAFHKEHRLQEFTVCYLAEALEQQELEMNWEFLAGNMLQVDSRTGENHHRVFSAKLLFE